MSIGLVGFSLCSAYLFYGAALRGATETQGGGINGSFLCIAVLQRSSNGFFLVAYCLLFCATAYVEKIIQSLLCFQKKLQII